MTLKDFRHSIPSLRQGECFLPPTAGDPLSSDCKIAAPIRMELPPVDIALKLNVVVVCAVFLFVGAILIGAF